MIFVMKGIEGDKQESKQELPNPSQDEYGSNLRRKHQTMPSNAS